MKDIDLQYLCTVIGNLSGIPIRLFQGDELFFYYSTVKLPKDPMLLYRDAIWQIQKNVGYFVTRHFHYYGIINSGDRKIIIGPTRQVTGNDQELRELAFRLDVSPEDTIDFIRGMKSIIPMPLESIMQILCTINYVLNGEKLTLQDITIFDDEQDILHQQTAQRRVQNRIEEPSPVHDIHNTYELEQTLLSIIRKGDTSAFREWVSNAPAVRGGTLATEQLRQIKNTFIVSVTLASRAAIRGGMDVEDAFSLSDSYIQKCELLNSPEKIMNLQYHMMMDYTQSVERVRLGKRPSKLVIDVANYVQHHLSEAISTQDMADTLFISRPHLSKRFREETGQTLTDFILREKTEEAKRLLRYTDKSLTAIGDYLGFSSQGHFSRVFKKYTRQAPSEYRDRYTR